MITHREAEAGHNPVAPLPAQGALQVGHHRGEHDRPKAGAAGGDAGDQGPPLLKPVADSSDGGDIHEAQPHAAQDAIEHHQHVDIDRERGDEDGEGGHDGSDDAGHPGTQLVDQQRGEGAGEENNACQDAADLENEENQYPDVIEDGRPTSDINPFPTP